MFAVDSKLIEKQVHQSNLKYINRSKAFFKKIGLPFAIVPSHQPDPPNAFFEGCWLAAGSLHFCPNRVQVGELLHEAAHLALLPKAEWASLKPGNLETQKIETLYGDAGAEAWDYAFAIATDIPLFALFTKGFGGLSWDVLRLLDLGTHPGIHLLEEAGFTVSFPKMKRWLAKESDIKKSYTTQQLQEYDPKRKYKSPEKTTFETLTRIHKLAKDHLRQGRLLEAGEYLHQVLKIMPNHAPTLQDVGMIMYQQKNYGAAYSLVKQALQQDPTLSSGYYLLGNLQMLQEVPTEAIASYRKAVSLNPNFAEAYYELARALASQKHYAEAITNYRTALSLRPDSAWAEAAKKHLLALST